MKTFKNYINEANYSRFLKQNKNLNLAQIKKINDYFSDENQQAGKKIEWQSKKVKNMTYNNFEDIMIKYESGRKQVLKPPTIPGKKNEDYIQLKLKNKNYLAYVPLNWKTAKYFNTKKFGPVQGEWCIGSTVSDYHWKDEVIERQQIPIYLFDTETKWVIMIQKENNRGNIWNIDNQYNVNHKIPNFDVKKDLLASNLTKIYDKLRKDIFIPMHFIEKAQISSDAKYTIKDDYFAWHNGTWKGGVWKFGLWKDGTWERGYWEGGTWKKGLWKYGEWQKGTWKDGTWNKGEWIYGTWEKGLWKNGSWEGGSWEGGTWEDGIWFYGTWKKGTWEKGIWEGGTWKGGTWKGGVDKDLNFHEAGDSPDKW